MADEKITQKTALTTPAGEDLLYIVDDPSGTPIGKKITLTNLFENVPGTIDLADITDNNIPYMSASGFADSPISTDASNDVIAIGIATTDERKILNMRADKSDIDGGDVTGVYARFGPKADSNTANISRLYGGEIRVDALGGGDYTATVGLRGVSTALDTEAAYSGTITGATWFYAGETSFDGSSPTNLYGIYIDSITEGANNYGVYQVSTSVDNYFFGGASFGDSITSGRATRALNLISSDATMRIWRISDTSSHDAGCELITSDSDGTIDDRWDIFLDKSEGSFNIRQRTKSGVGVEDIKFYMDNSGNVSFGHTGPDTILDIDGAFTFRELSSDPSAPDEGAAVLWMSDGTGTGDDGDVLLKITAGGVTKTTTLADFSGL